MITKAKPGSKSPQSPNGARQPKKAQKPEKWLFLLPYISHNVHYTKQWLSKKAAALLSFYRDSGGGLWCSGRIPASFCKTVRSYLYSRVDAVFFIKALQRSETRFFFFGDAMFFIPAMAVCQSMRRSLHNRFAPPSGSLPHCQSVPHPLHWSQSTVQPERPGNPHLPAR